LFGDRSFCSVLFCFVTRNAVCEGQSEQRRLADQFRQAPTRRASMFARLRIRIDRLNMYNWQSNVLAKVMLDLESFCTPAYDLGEKVLCTKIQTVLWLYLRFIAFVVGTRNCAIFQDAAAAQR
jgi:hypothetical protein